MARNLTGEDLLQIELLPAVTIRHKDLVLIRRWCLDHMLGGILLVLVTLTGGERVCVEGYAGVQVGQDRVTTNMLVIRHREAGIIKLISRHVVMGAACHALGAGTGTAVKATGWVQQCC